jgi:raffinose/stachyose/melibiose transport system permease protein
MIVLILVNVWQYAGMTMVIYLAGLQAIPGELYEAAKMDGASSMGRFRYVTIPLLIPSIRINVVTNIIGSLSVFDIVMSLTGGGPGYSTETLSIYIMRMCYGSKTGYSTAVAMIMFFIILVPVLISMRLTRTKSMD